MLSLAGNANTVTLGSSASLAGISTIVGGNANDRIAFDTQARFAADSVIGGSGTDTLAILGQVTGLNDSFANVTGVEVLSLSGGSNSLTLGSSATVAGISTINGGTGNDSFSQTAGSFYLFGGDGNDSFSVTNAAMLRSDTIDGGSGSNSITLTTDGQTLIDSDFQKLAAGNIQQLIMANGNNRITLAANAQAAGINSVTGGTGSDTIDASAYSASVRIQAWSGAAAANTNSDTIVAGAAGSDLFVIANAGDTDNAYGNGGTDTAYISGFKIKTGAQGTVTDQLQLHEFGSGASDYSTLLSGSTLDIWHGAQTPSNLVAELTISNPNSSGFNLQDIAKFV